MVDSQTTLRRLNLLQDKVCLHPFWEGALFSLFESVASNERLATIVLREYLHGASIYGSHFHEYLQNLIERMEDIPIRKTLIHNLNEERGYSSDGKIKVGDAHTVLFSDLKNRLDAVAPVGEVSPHPLVEQVQSLIRQKMRSEDVMVGVGSIIFGSEMIVPRLYSRIVEFIDCAGLPETFRSFFKLHIECDQNHSAAALKALSLSRLSVVDMDMLEFGAISAMNLRSAMFDAIALNVKRNCLGE